MFSYSKSLNSDKHENLKSQIQGISLMFFFALIFVSCSPEEITLPSNVEKSLRQEDVFLSPQGWLVFKDDSTFLNIVEKLHQTPRTEIEAWEKSIGFTSLNSIYEQAIDEQESYCAQFEQASPEQIRELIASNKIHAPFVETHKELFSFNDDKTFDMNIVLPFFKYGKVLNTSNLVQVGKEIRMYHQDMYKVLIDGDLAKIGLLVSATETDEEKGIFVNKVIKYSEYRTGRVQLDCQDTSNGNNVGSEKVEGKGNPFYSQYYSVNNFPYMFHYRGVYVSAVNKIKSPIIGWNKKRTTALRAFGQVRVRDLILNQTNTLTFNYGTNGMLKSEIYSEIYSLSSAGWFNYQLILAEGEYTVQGRGNTSCTQSF